MITININKGKTLPTVLYVDDEVDNLIAFTAQFKRSFNVLTAMSAAEGLELLGQIDVHVIISDQRMPEMTGIQLLEQVRDRYPDVMRVVLTAYTEAEDIIDAINRGAVYSYIKKPWNRDDLQQVIDKCFFHFDVRRRSKQAMGHLYDSVDNMGRLTRRIPLELRSELDSQYSILVKAMGESDSQMIAVHLNKMKDSLAKIKELVDISEAEYADMKTSADLADGDETKFLENLREHGLYDEDLIFVMMQFPDKKARIHRLHVSRTEFRQLSLDYYECNKFLTKQADTQPAMSDDEYKALKEELEADIRAYLDETI